MPLVYLLKKFSTIKSPPNPLNTKENNDAPNKIKKTIEFIFSVSIQTDFKGFFGDSFFAAIINEPSAPNEADSVGVAIPKRIEPNTNIIRRIGGKIVKNKLFKTFFSFDLNRFSMESLLV